MRVIYVMTHDFDRPRRGRPDPSAGRASGGAARDPEPAGVPPGRRDRDRRVLAACARSDRRSDRARADPPEPAAGAHGSSDDNLCAAAPTRSRRARRRARRSTIFATGSEVEIALAGAEACSKEHGVAARVVSVPCFELFLEQDDGLPPRHHRQRARSRSRVEAARPPGLGCVHRRGRRLRRHDRFRRQRPLQGTLPAFRHHGRGGRGGCAADLAARQP